MKKAWVVWAAVVAGTALACVSSFAGGKAGGIRLVTREVSLGKIDPGIFPETLAVSPDSKRVAYEAGRGKKQLVVVDGVEGKEYDGIGEWSALSSPDSKRVAYGARRGKKWLVVVDGVEGKEYDRFIRGSTLVFDAPNLLHGLAVRGDEIFRVEVEIAEE